MIVVADTTPLNYLIVIGHSNVLPVLYGRVLIPEAVYQELQHPRTPAVVRDKIAGHPSWLKVRHVERPNDLVWKDWMPENKKRSCWQSRLKQICSCWTIRMRVKLRPGGI
jgi:hypothetical protein